MKGLCIGGPCDGEYLSYHSPQHLSVEVEIYRRRELRGFCNMDTERATVVQYLPTRCGVGKKSTSGFREQIFHFLRFEEMDERKAVDEFAERELGIVAPSPPRPAGAGA